MSSAQPETHPVSPWIARLPRLRAVIAVALLMTAVGFGVHSVMNRRVEVIDDSELEVLDDLVANELAEPSQARPRALATATITDVVPAVHHQASDDATVGVQLAAHANGVRPESKPPVWLMGTIEESAPSTSADPNPAAFPFQRFTR